jgi:magnesium transporter
MPKDHKRHTLRLLAPDDLPDLLQSDEPEPREDLMVALDPLTRREVTALLAYEEDEAGGLMNPRFARVRPDMSVDEALKYLRRQAEGRLETMRYVYVLGPEQRLLGVVSLRQLFMAPSQSRVSDIMRTNLVCADENLDQEELRQLFSRSALMAVPVIDDEHRMKGIVTVDDIVEVVEEEATEDIQRLGGTEVLDAPYLRVNLFEMIRKRAGWLVILFIGEMLTATAMAYYEQEIAKAVVLALFIPLIISSGGNSGSQASTLVVRAMALNEVHMRDWWRIFRREIVVGSMLGAILGGIGFLRIVFWPTRAVVYGEHYVKIGLTVAVSLIGVVLWGSLSGSMLPFVLRRFKLDPAVASAPFVATLVDVFGVVIYFTVASIFLRGTLL